MMDKETSINIPGKTDRNGQPEGSEKFPHMATHRKVTTVVIGAGKMFVFCKIFSYSCESLNIDSALGLIHLLYRVGHLHLTHLFP